MKSRIQFHLGFPGLLVLLLVTEMVSGQVYLCEFPGRNLAVGESPLALAAADLNGDGKLDLGMSH